MKRAILIIITLAIALGGLFLMVRQVVIDNVKISTASIIAVEEENLNRKILDWQDDLKKISRQQDLYLLADKIGKKNYLRERRILEQVFRDFLRTRKDYIKQIRYIDRKGIEQVVVDKDGPSHNFLNVSKELFFLRAINQRPFQTSGSLSGNTSDNSVLEYSINLTSHGFVIGIVTIDIDIDSVVKTFRETGDKIAFNHVYVFDEQSNLVYDKRLKVSLRSKKSRSVKTVYATVRNSSTRLEVFELGGRFWAYFDNQHLNLTLFMEMEDNFLNQKVFEKFLPIAVLFLIASFSLLFIKRKKKRIVRKGSLLVPENAASKKQATNDLDDRVRLKDLSNISNQIRIPVNNLLGTLSLLRVTELSSKQNEYLDLVTRHSEWVLELLNEITDYSALKRGALRLDSIDFNIRHIINNVTELLANEAYKKGIEVFNVVRYDVPERIAGDPTRLRQVLVNLVGNAIKSSEQGDISLNVATLKTKGDTVIIRIEISESGVGVETEFAYTIFTEFEKGGTLPDDDSNRNLFGINISKQLVQMMGGTIGYNDTAMGGSTFWLEIPFKIASESKKPAESGALQGVRALILGERESNRKSAAAMLSSWGISCETSGDFERVLDFLKRHAETGRAFDLLLMDISVSSSTDKAFELIRKLKSEASLDNTKIAILTSRGVPGDSQIAKELGVKAYLTKPINRNQLKDAILEVVNNGNLDHSEENSNLVTTPGLREKDFPNAPVLIVETNKTYQKVLSGLVARLGLDSDIASGGKEALHAIRARSYGMVLLDYHLPDVSALEITQNIRKLEDKLANNKKSSEERNIRTPIVFLVNSLKDSDKNKCTKEGVDDFLYKPVSSEALSAVLSRWDLLKQNNVLQLKM